MGLMDTESLWAFFLASLRCKTCSLDGGDQVIGRCRAGDFGLIRHGYFRIGDSVYFGKCRPHFTHTAGASFHTADLERYDLGLIRSGGLCRRAGRRIFLGSGWRAPDQGKASDGYCSHQ